MTRKGAMTDVERERYRQARASAAIVRVNNALCWSCTLKRIGRYTIAPVQGVYQVQDTCQRHIHMTYMCGNAASSAAMAREDRRRLADCGAEKAPK